LALVCPAAPEEAAPQPQASARGNINDIQPPSDAEIPTPAAPPEPPSSHRPIL
jgi:hypothetical protein